MKVSILIPLYNSERYIADTIQSALNQTWEDKEIIIVDDGSTDNSYNIAKSFESEIVTVFRQENKGAPSARNLAFQKATGVYIQYLDADDLMMPNKIESQLMTLSKYSYNKDIVAFCGWNKFNFSETCDYTKKIESECYQDYTPAYLALIKFWNLSFPSIPYHNYLTHRSKIQEVGRWNEDLSKNQDSEFFARVIGNSKSLIYCSAPIVYYRDVPNSLSKVNSLRKVVSEYQVDKSIANIILSRNRTKEAILACSFRFTEFIDSRYPLNKPLLADTYKFMKENQLSYVTFHRGVVYQALYFIFGWRLTRILFIPYKRIKGLFWR